MLSLAGEEQTMPCANDVTAAIEAWIADLTDQGRSPDTIASYRYALTLFARWLEQQAASFTLDTLSLQVFSQYVTALQSRKLSDTTIRAYIGILTRWVHDLINQGELAGIPNRRGRLITAAGLRDALERQLDRPEPPVAPRMPDLRRLPAYYDVQLHHFLQRRGQTIPTNTEPGPLRTYLNLLRNRALIATLFSTGGRINEILGLTVAAVAVQGRVANVVSVTGKGRKRRPLRLDRDAQSWIMDYLHRRQACFPTASAVFISHGPNGAGNRLSDVTAWKVVKAAAEALADVRMQEGADAEELRTLRGVSPHSLRHYLAQAMLDEGADYKDITAILGHSSSVVTEQFYARLGDERTIEIADTFAPRMNPLFDPSSPDDASV